MKESSGGGALEERGRSASDREKTKLRERQRRSITTKIFNGLRKHGGYTLPPRADINDVLRELAKEAGWVVEPDGTTYRAKGSCHPSPSLQHCAACVAGKSSGATTPTSSLGGGGDGSTTGSPCHVAIQHPSPSSSEAAVGSTVRYFPGTSSSRNLTPDRELSLSLASDDVTAYFMRVAHFGGLGYGGLGGSHASTAVVLPHHHHPFFQEARASNQNTPVGSPQRHA